MKNKLIAILTVLLALVCFALPAMAEDYTFIYGGDGVTVGDYPVEYSSKEYMYPTPLKNDLIVPGKDVPQGGGLYKLFNLIDTNRIKTAEPGDKVGHYASMPVYCFDYDTHAVPGSGYKAVELNKHNIGYLNGANMKKLRGILQNSYPKIQDMNVITQKVNDWLSKKYGAGNYVPVQNLNVQECILATQSAIWHFTNNIDVNKHVNGRNETNVQISPGDCIYPELLDINNDGVLHGELDVKATEQRRANCEHLYNYLTDTKDGVPEANPIEIPEYKFTSLSASLKEQIDQKYTATVTVNLNEVPGTGANPLSIQVVCGSLQSTVVQTTPGVTQYTLTLKNVPSFDSKIEAKLDGVQLLEDVFLFEAMGGYTASQTLGGFMQFKNITSLSKDITSPTVNPLQATIKLNGTKNITNRTFKPGDVFTFEITAPNGAPLPENTKATIRPSNHSEHGIQFDPITYTTANLGENVYYITETNTGIGGISYDTAKIKVVVTVGSNANGQFEAKVTSIQKMIDNTTTNVDKVEFTNTYNATGNVQLKAKKTLTGRLIEEGQFRFQLKDGDGVILDEKPNDSEGNVSFDPISYGLADAGKTFTYSIKEVNDKKPGYTYDEKEYEIKVEVTDKGDGTLKATIIEGSDVVGFENTYQARGTVELSAKKTLTGRLIEEGQFRFQLKDGDGAVLQTKTNDADGNVKFDTISYDEKAIGKTFTYTISEIDQGKPGYTYDKQTKTITVKVIDNGDGTLSTEVTGNGELAGFENTYTVTPTTYAPKAYKMLDGEEPTDPATFTFKLTAGASNPADGAVMSETTASVKGAGEAAFGDITFKKEGTYTFTIAEEKGNANGYTYDSTPWKLTVVIVDDDSKLKAQIVKYEQQKAGGTNSAEYAVFTNDFAVRPTSFAPEVSKIVTGVPLKAETHVFAISEAGEHKAGSVAMPLDPTASVTGAGTAQFGAIEFRSKGVYTFKITEIAGRNPACKYSDHEWLLTVTVTETDGNLHATGMYESNDNPDAAIPKFENFYKPGGITVTKTVTGKQIDKQVPFTFTLKVLLEDGTMHDGVYVYTITSEDGLKVAGDTLENGGTFELKHGERIVVDGMPVGATYQVEELDANKNGYTTASVNEVGKVMLDELAEVEFINHMLPVTGDHDQPLLYAALCLLALMGMCQLRKKHC